MFKSQHEDGLRLFVALLLRLLNGGGVGKH